MDEPGALRQLLDHLELVWQDRHPAATDTLRPGLTSEQIDSAAGPLPFPVPDEARVLWEWHDGQSVRRESERLGGALRLLTVEQAVERYYFNLRTFEGVRADLPESYEPTWLPLMDGESAHSVLINAKSGDIVLHSWMDDGEPIRSAFPSLAVVIRLCTAAITEGAWQFHGEGDVDTTDRDWGALQRIATTPASLALLRG